MNCKNCGNTADKNDKFCRSCGTKIDQETISDIMNFEPQKNEMKKVSDKKETFEMESLDWDLEPFKKEKTSEKIEEKVVKFEDDSEFEWEPIIKEKELPNDDLSSFDWSLPKDPVVKEKENKSEIKVKEVEIPFVDKEELPIDDVEAVDKEVLYTENHSSKSNLEIVNEVDTEDIKVENLTLEDIIEEDSDAADEENSKKKIDKFYTFNQKNEEFQALLDKEYERLKKRIEEESSSEQDLKAKFDGLKEELELMEKNLVTKSDKGREEILEKTLEINLIEEELEKKEVLEEAKPIPFDVFYENELSQRQGATSDDDLKLDSSVIDDVEEVIIEQPQAPLDIKGKDFEEYEDFKLEKSNDLQDDNINDIKENLKEYDKSINDEKSINIAQNEEELNVSEDKKDLEENTLEKEDNLEPKLESEKEIEEVDEVKEEPKEISQGEYNETLKEEPQDESKKVDKEDSKEGNKEDSKEGNKEDSEDESKEEKKVLKSYEGIFEDEEDLDKTMKDKWTSFTATLFNLPQEIEEEQKKIDKEKELKSGKKSEENTKVDKKKEVEKNTSKKEATKKEPTNNKKKSAIVIDILIVILSIVVITLAIGMFLPDTTPGKYINKYFSEVTTFFTGTEPIVEDEDVAIEIKEDDGMEKAVKNAKKKYPNLGKVSLSKTLNFNSKSDYGNKNLSKSLDFKDTPWYSDKKDNPISYGNVIVDTALNYYSDYLKLVNDGNKDVLSILTKDTEFYKLTESLEPKDENLKIESINIGEIRRFDTNYFLIVEVNEKLGDKEIVKKIQVITLTPGDKSMTIDDVTDKK